MVAGILRVLREHHSRIYDGACQYQWCATEGVRLGGLSVQAMFRPCIRAAQFNMLQRVVWSETMSVFRAREMK